MLYGLYIIPFILGGCIGNYLLRRLGILPLMGKKRLLKLSSSILVTALPLFITLLTGYIVFLFKLHEFPSFLKYYMAYFFILSVLSYSYCIFFVKKNPSVEPYPNSENKIMNQLVIKTGIEEEILFYVSVQTLLGALLILNNALCVLPKIVALSPKEVFVVAIFPLLLTVFVLFVLYLTVFRYLRSDMRDLITGSLSIFASGLCLNMYNGTYDANNYQIEAFPIIIALIFPFVLAIVFGPKIKKLDFELFLSLE